MLKAYQVDQILVFATRGTEAKLMAAPLLRPHNEWKEDVAGWVALRAERCPEKDKEVDEAATGPYVVKEAKQA